MRVVAAALALAALAPLAGCGASTAASSSVTSTAARPVGEKLVGRYAHYDVVAYEGSNMKTLIISYGFTDLAMKGDTLMATESFCHSDQRSNLPIETGMTDAGTSAIKPIETPVTVTEKGGVLHLSRPESPTGIGIKLADPAHDKLPTDPNDPRITDDDHDGKPGVTVNIKVTDTLSGQLYIARREIFAYEVDANPDKSLTGLVSDHSEQLIVGASSDVFKVDGQWTQHPDLKKSPIILKLVDASWDCTKLMAERPTLFPPTPSVDW